MDGCIEPRWSMEALSHALISESDNFVYELNGKVVGYALIENVIDEGCLTSIAVIDECRRQGGAKELLQLALSESKMKSVYLEVNENNTPAINLYLSFGFIEIGRRKKYYGESTAIVLRKELV